MAKDSFVTGRNRELSVWIIEISREVVVERVVGRSFNTLDPIAVFIIRPASIDNMF